MFYHLIIDIFLLLSSCLPVNVSPQCHLVSLPPPFWSRTLFLLLLLLLSEVRCVIGRQVEEVGFWRSHGSNLWLRQTPFWRKLWELWTWEVEEKEEEEKRRKRGSGRRERRSSRWEKFDTNAPRRLRWKLCWFCSAGPRSGLYLRAEPLLGLFSPSLASRWLRNTPGQGARVARKGRDRLTLPEASVWDLTWRRDCVPGPGLWRFV